MIIDKAPHIRILEALVATLELVNFEDRAGVVGVTIRHTRNRYPTSSEKPCISVRWLGNEDQADEQYANAWERYKLCNIDLVADAAIEAEDSQVDETGWDRLSRMLAAAFEKLREEGTPLYDLMNWVQDRDTDPDEDSKPDEGRLVQAISVLYRVRTDQPNVLLAQGENG